jgi:hypothetical protein
MTQKEEMLIQNKLMDIIEKLGISEQDFQRNTMYHGQDQAKGMQIMQMQQQTANSGGDEMPLLSKEEVMATFKIQQEIQMESMDLMMKEGMANPQSQEGQMMMMMKMMVQQSKAQDKLFERTGVEEEQLNSSIQRLGLQSDPEFMQMVQENMAKVMAKAQQHQGGMPGMGGPMGGMF